MRLQLLLSRPIRSINKEYRQHPVKIGTKSMKFRNDFLECLRNQGWVVSSKSLPTLHRQDTIDA